MYRRPLAILATILALAALPSAARGGGGPTQSIEWRAAHNDVVITGTVTGVRPDSFRTFAVDVHVTRTLKGVTRPDVTFVYSRFGDSKGQAFSPAKGETLFFLLRGADVPPDRRQDPAAWERLTLEDREVNAVPLAALVRVPVWSCTFRPLNDIDEIAAAIATAAPRTSPPRPIALKPPPTSPAFAALGADEQFVVPDDDRWKLPYLQYVTRLPHWWTLIRDRLALKSPETIAFMTALLDDPTWERRRADHWPRSIPWFDTRDYVVRRAALALLRSWGQRTSAPVLEDPLLPGRRVPRELVFAPLLIVPFLVFPRRVPLPRRIWNLPTVLCTIAAVAVGALWFQSRFAYLALLFTTPGGECEFSSLDGRLRYLYVDDRPVVQEPVLRTASLNDRPLLPDHLEHFVAVQTVTHLGVQRTTGVTPPTTAGPPTSIASNWFNYRLLQLPHSTLLFVLLVLPFSRVVALVTRRSIARCRRATGRCANCGYDLRSSAGRCPECGHSDRLS